MIGRFRSEFELAIDLVEQVFCLLSMALHVPFIGLLGGDDLLERHLAVTLGGGEIGMACARNIADGFLGDSSASNDKEATENSS